MADQLFLKSKVREYIKSKGCNTSSIVIDGDGLNNIIKEILNKAVGRAKGNKRKTVKARDL